MTEKKTITPAREFFAGCVAGFSKIYTGQPFDIVKVRLQSAQGATSPLVILKDILKNEGFFALWKGSLPPLLGVGATASLQFGVNENVKKMIIRYNEGARMSFAQLCLAGGLGGLANCLVSTPAEHFRILMQTQSKENPIYKGSVDCMKKIYTNYGIKGVYKGGVPTICRDTLGYGVYFAAFSTLMEKFHPGQPRTEHSLLKIGFAGSLSGIILWSCAFPFDVVKTKIQTDSVLKPKYNGMADCFRQVYRSNGIVGFYKGYVPAFLRAIPVNGVVFVLYEILYRSLLVPVPVLLNSI